MDTTSNDTTQNPAPDIDALRARAKELGLKHHPNLGAPKLAALVAEAEAKVPPADTGASAAPPDDGNETTQASDDEAEKAEAARLAQEQAEAERLAAEAKAAEVAKGKAGAAAAKAKAKGTPKSDRGEPVVSEDGRSVKMPEGHTVHLDTPVDKVDPNLRMTADGILLTSADDQG